MPEQLLILHLLTFAQRALAAAAILALPAALILCFFGAATATGFIGEPKIRSSLFSRDWILSLMSAARRNCCAEQICD